MRKMRFMALALVVGATLACQLLSGNTQVPGSPGLVPGTEGTAPGQPGGASTATSVPSVATRPLLAFAGQGGLWVANPDGSALRQVTNIDLSQTDVREAISPSGDRLAAVVPNDKGLDLVLVSIPGGETKTLAHLIDVSPDELASNPTGAAAFAYYAIANYNSVAWQPGDSRYLAFMGAIKGPSSDLYVYDFQDDKITQLTDGPSQAILPSWSPDGKYILHDGVSWTPPFGGAIVGYNRLDGVWAVQISDKKVITEPKPKGDSVNFVGWLDGSHYITFDSKDTSNSTPACSNTSLRSVDVGSGKSTPIMSGEFNDIGFIPTNKAVIFTSKADCKDPAGQGLFMLMPGQITPIKLADELPYEFSWLPESQLIEAYPQALFSPDGTTRIDTPVPTYSFHPAISKMGYQAWELIQNQKGSVVVKSSGGDLKPIFTGFANQLIWDPITAQTLFIAGDDAALYEASAPDFAAEPIGKIGGINQAIWIP